MAFGLAQGIGALFSIAGTAMARKGRDPALGEVEQTTLRRKGDIEGLLYGAVRDRLRDPNQNLLSAAEQKTYEQRGLDIYGEYRERERQQLTASYNRAGILGSGAHMFGQREFSRGTLRDYQRFYLEDRRRRLQEKEGAFQGAVGAGQSFLSGANIGARQTSVGLAKARAHNEWINRWSSTMMTIGSGLMGTEAGKAAGGYAD